MKNFMRGFIVVFILASGSPAFAQSTIGGILNDVFGGLVPGRQGADQIWHGHFVQAKGTTMIFRASDGTPYAVDMSAIATPWNTLALGQPVTLAVRPGSAPQTVIASRLDAEQADPATGRLREARPFQSVHGAVERVDGTQLTVRTLDGRLLPVDVARMTGEAEFRAQDGAVVILEPGSQTTVLWIEREDRRYVGTSSLMAGLSPEFKALHGFRVHGSGTTLIFLADDGTTSRVNMAGVDAVAWSSIQLGEALMLSAKPGPTPNTLIVARVQADPAPRRPFVSAQGTVDAVQGPHIRFRTDEGVVVRADVSKMPDRGALRATQRGVLIYEPGARPHVTALWLEPDNTPSAAASPSSDTAGQFRRIRGYVQSVGVSTMSLKNDDGHMVEVDTRAVETRARTAVRPGDLVSVSGRTTMRTDQFVAVSIERQARR